MRIYKDLVRSYCPPKNLTPDQWINIGGAGVNLLGNLLGINSQQKINKAQLQLQQQALQEQKYQFDTQLQYNRNAEERSRQYALQDFVMENQYNNASAQRQRLEAAGLNPALFFDSSSVGQMEATSVPTSPSPGGLPGAPPLQNPDWSSLGMHVQQAANNFYENEVKREQAEQLSIDNETRRVQNILELSRRVAEIDDILSRSNLNKEQFNKLLTEQELLKEELKFQRATHDDRVRGVSLANDVNESVKNMNQANIRKIDTEQRILSIEEKYKEAIIQEGLRLSAAQRRSVSQGILESIERIKDLSERRQDDLLTSKELRNKCKEEAKKICRERLNIDPSTEVGRKNVELLEAQIYNYYHSESSNFFTVDRIYNPSTGKYDRPGAGKVPSISNNW